ncbi:MAG: hypothetical protein IJR55_03500 [Clostridia bacterium]|nr:hypothetical protein [Clostridia bacterium]
MNSENNCCKTLIIVLFALIALLCLSSCASRTPTAVSDVQSTRQSSPQESHVQPITKTTVETDFQTSKTESTSVETQTTTFQKYEENTEMKTLKLKIGDTRVAVVWEENESVAALAKLVKDKPLTVSMSMYGGFEQVGSLGTSIPRNDKNTTTCAGDIVLYSGNQIVLFYGSNSWAYTRLGHIVDKTAEEMTRLLGSGDVTVTLFTDAAD